MRTTIRLDAALLADAKKLAAESGQTLTRVIEDALRMKLARQKVRRKSPPLRLPTTKGRGLLPGVDLDDSSALLERMEARS